MASARQAAGLRGVSDLRKKLRKLPKEAREGVQKEVKDWGDAIRFEQLRDAPKDSGDLAASIEVKLGGDKLSGTVGPGARTKKAKRLAGWRAHFSEFGTVKMRARPFIRRSLEKNRARIAKDMGIAVKRAIDRVSKER